MTGVSIQLPEDEARALYREIHRRVDGQDVFCEAYRQLQTYFFSTMTVQQVTTLLEGDQ